MLAARLVESGLPDNNLTQDHRIRKAKDFEQVFQKGFKLITPTLIFRILVNDGVNSRLGLAVPKKVGNAVIRNLVRRRIREAFRLTKASFGTRIDIVVSPRRGIREKGFQEYLQSFEFLAKKTRMGFKR